MKKVIIISLLLVIVFSLFLAAPSFSSSENILSEQNRYDLQIREFFYSEAIVDELISKAMQGGNNFIFKTAPLTARLRTIFSNISLCGTVSYHTFLSFLRQFIFTIFLTTLLLVMIIIATIHNKDGKKSLAIIL